MLTFEKKGYIAIVVAIFVPIVLYGVKFMLDNMSAHRATMEKTASDDVKKHCAKDAALQVAKNWNPGLTLGQQKAAVLKVADAVYNASPCYFTDSVIGRAIYGLDVKKGHKATNRHPYMPTNVSFTRTKPTLKTISYNKATKFVKRYCFYYKDDKNHSLWNRDYAWWRIVDRETSPENRVIDFDEVTGSGANYTLNHHDIYSHIAGCSNGETCIVADDGAYFPNNTNCYKGWGDFCATLPGKSSNTTDYHPNKVFSGVQLESKTPKDTSDPALSNHEYHYRTKEKDDTVQISIKGDKIRVLTDDDVGYSKPAECNVDIVLAVPVNSAACNINNLDAASAAEKITVTKGDGTTEEKDPDKNPVSFSKQYDIPSVAQSTPIYQIGQACKGFVKQFYHTRGVNMSLIPYSAKVSISPDKTGYVNGSQTFNDSYFRNNPLSYDKICGAALYYTRGERDTNLATAPVWGGMLTGCPIMCRRGETTTPTDYGQNPVYSGNLFSIAKPVVNSASGYQRMSLNPCYLGYANLLSLKCDMTCKTYLPNPFYMIEPTADLVKIYEMCNALYPYYDLYSVSNFIFIPLEWARNFFQTWTNDPWCSASANNASESAQVLSRSKKSTHKKAVILIVNKPDWFEPGELTYLGFDNDASEISMVESDKIRFDINYGDTTKRFLDGSYYNTNHTSGIYTGINNTGLIAGAKKILKFKCTSGTMSYDSTLRSYIFSDGAKCQLTYPRKALIKIVVKPSYYNWEVISTGPASIRSEGWKWHNFIYVPEVSKFFAVNDVGKLITSPYGVSWSEVTKGKFSEWPGSTYFWGGIAYGGDKFVVVFDDGRTKDFYRWNSSDSTMYTGPSLGGISSTYWRGGICYGNGKFYVSNGAGYIAYFDQPSYTWKLLTTLPNTSWDNGIAYGNGILMVLDAHGSIKVSADGEHWGDRDRVPCFVASEYKTGELAFGGGEFLAVRDDGYLMSSPDGYDWVSVGKLDGTGWLNACYADGSFYVLSYGGSVAKRQPGTITFGNTNKNGPYTISKEQAFYFRPEDLKNDTSMTMTLNGVQLVSAEIMNFDLDFVTPKNVAYKDVEFAPGETLSFGTRSYQEAYQEAYTVKKVSLSSYSSYHPTSTQLWAIASSGSNYAAVGGNALSGGSESSVVTYSSGGTSWSSGSISCSKMLRGVCGTGGKFIAVGHGGALFDSSDGSSWSKGTTLPRSAYCIIYAGGIFVVATASGYVVRSAGDNSWAWDSKSTGFSGDVYKIAYGNSTYVAVGAGGGISTSSDSAKTWTKRTSPTSNALESVGYGNSVFVAGGAGGVIITSNDNGVTWTKRTSNCSSIIRGVAYCNSVFCAVGESAVVASADNGVTWVSVTKPASNLRGAAAIGGYIYMVSASGYIYRTKPSVTTETKYRTAYRTKTVNCLWSTNNNTDIVLSQYSGSNVKISKVSAGNLTWDSSANSYYYDLENGYTGRAAVRTTSKTKTVDDMIDFCDSTTSKNGVLVMGATEGGMNNGLWQQVHGYTEIKLKKRGKLKLRIGPALWASSGAFSIRSGIDEEIRNFHDSEFTNTAEWASNITSPMDIIVDIRNQTPNSDGTYTVRFGVNDISLINAEFIQDPIPNFKAFHDKTYLKNSRSIDYSDLSQIKYDNNAFCGNIFLGTYLDKNRGRHATAKSADNSSGSHHDTSNVGPSGIPGDMQSIQNDFGASPSWVYYGFKGYNLGAFKMNWQIYHTGCLRVFNPHWRSGSYKHFTISEYSGYHDTATGGKQEILTHELTYPLNWILWKNGYQSGFSGVSGTTPTEAVRKVTVDVCKKLKTEWGSNLKIYIIKYRGQKKYMTFPFTNATQTEETYNYEYLYKASSSSSGDKPCADVFYEAADSSALTACLNNIAKDIKSTSFANYKAAQVVE